LAVSVGEAHGALAVAAELADRDAEDNRRQVAEAARLAEGGDEGGGSGGEGRPLSLSRDDGSSFRSGDGGGGDGADPIAVTAARHRDLVARASAYLAGSPAVALRCRAAVATAAWSAQQVAARLGVDAAPPPEVARGGGRGFGFGGSAAATVAAQDSAWEMAAAAARDEDLTDQHGLADHEGHRTVANSAAAAAAAGAAEARGFAGLPRDTLAAVYAADVGRCPLLVDAQDVTSALALGKKATVDAALAALHVSPKVGAGEEGARARW
jgi:hypothetical protein